MHFLIHLSFYYPSLSTDYHLSCEWLWWFEKSYVHTLIIIKYFFIAILTSKRILTPTYQVVSSFILSLFYVWSPEKMIDKVFCHISIETSPQKIYCWCWCIQEIIISISIIYGWACCCSTRKQKRNYLFICGWEKWLASKLVAKAKNDFYKFTHIMHFL